MYKTKRPYFRHNQNGLHAHHIVPIHAGGTNDESNIVFLTIEEHALAHKELFEKYGRWQDKIAWQMLSGMIGKEEAIHIAQKNSDKSWIKTPEGRELLRAAQKRCKDSGRKPDPWNKGLTKNDDIRLQKSSELAKLHMAQGRLNCIGDHLRGKTFNDTHKKNLSETAKKRPKIKCEHCGKEMIKQMYVRWHGDNCASRRG